MIVFDLECVNGHSFEGWFDDGDDFERQHESGMIRCPLCETCSVSKKLSAVSVRTSSNAAAQNSEYLNTIAKIGEKLATYIDNNFENVGSGFAKEALKIHYGVSEPKNIRGTTTEQDDKMLAKEGVPVIKFGNPAGGSKEDLN